MAIIKFLANTPGRWVRIVVGIALIAVGLLTLKDTVGIMVAIVGVVPLVAGIFDFCVFAPLFRLPFSGKAIRTTP